MNSGRGPPRDRLQRRLIAVLNSAVLNPASLPALGGGRRARECSAEGRHQRANRAAESQSSDRVDRAKGHRLGLGAFLAFLARKSAKVGVREPIGHGRGCRDVRACGVTNRSHAVVYCSVVHGRQSTPTGLHSRVAFLDEGAYLNQRGDAALVEATSLGVLAEFAAAPRKAQ